MALDIENGDVLVVGSSSYAIRAVEHWPLAGLAASFGGFQTSSASTKRASTDGTTGKRTLATVESSLTILPVMPLDPETRERFGDLASPHKLRQTFLHDSSELLRLVVEAAE